MLIPFAGLDAKKEPHSHREIEAVARAWSYFVSKHGGSLRWFTRIGTYTLTDQAARAGAFEGCLIVGAAQPTNSQSEEHLFSMVQDLTLMFMHALQLDVAEFGINGKIGTGQKNPSLPAPNVKFH